MSLQRFYLTFFMMSKQNNKIVILTGPIHTGKSKALLQWVKDKEAAGIITPTISNRKKMFDVASKVTHPYQEDVATVDNIQIGKYFINKKAFEITATIVHKSVLSPQKWFILDEIGKLELDKKGHHKIIEKLLATWQYNLLFVVREELLEQAVAHYNLANIEIIEKENLASLV